MHLGSFVNENSIWYTIGIVYIFKLYGMATESELGIKWSQIKELYLKH